MSAGVFSVFVLHEYSDALRQPHGTAHIRLLRPLTHPALADTVEAKACGAVVDHLTPASLIDALDRLLRHHHQMEAAAQEVGNGFDRKTFLDAHAALYQDVLERSRAGRSP